MINTKKGVIVMSNVNELKDEDLEKVSGGLPQLVSDVVNGAVYRKKTDYIHYVKASGFSGWTDDTVIATYGEMQDDGKIHRCTYQSSMLWKYSNF